MKSLSVLFAFIAFIAMGCGEGTTVVCPDPVTINREVVQEIEIEVPTDLPFEETEIVGRVGWLVNNRDWMYYDEINGVRTQYIKKIYCEIAQPVSGSSHQMKIIVNLLEDTIVLQNPGPQYVGKWTLNTIIITDYIAPGEYTGYLLDAPTKK